MMRSTLWMLSAVVAVAVANLRPVALQAEEIAVGSPAPSFSSQGIDGQVYSLDGTKGAKATVLAFTCNRCPVAIAYEDRFIDFQKKYADKGVKFIAINVNSSEDLEAMKQRAEEKGLNYPYAYDASGDSARAYGARVTPHLFVIDGAGKVAYHGSFDDKQNDPTAHHVADAVDAILSGKSPEVQSTKAFGCGIKPNKK
jgi:peroxiredoxin